VENYHAISGEHEVVHPRELEGKARAWVLNDEAHHVANESGRTQAVEGVSRSGYGFRMVVGAVRTLRGR
jgi:hypothetical protein